MSIFNTIPSFTPPRSKQIQKSSRACDMELGIAYPIYFKSLVPGDNVHFSMNDVIKSLPMIKPTMGNLDLCVNAFFVDNRQIDPNFEDNLSGGEMGDVEFTQVIDDAFNEDSDSDSRCNGNKMAMHCKKYSLMDYCGAPLLKDSDVGAFIGDNVYMLPYWALSYNRCWNYYYRDENVCIDAEGKPLLEHDKIGDGRIPFGKIGNSVGNAYCLKPGSGLKHVYLEKDYLSACLPRKQKGGPFAFPISGSIPIGFNVNNSTKSIDSELGLGINSSNGHETLGYYADGTPVSITSNGNYDSEIFDINGNSISTVVSEGSIYDGKYRVDTFSLKTTAPLSGSIGESSVTFTYDEFREIRALQLYAERMNLCGSRYEEFLMSMFSVAPHSDTLREPVWLGGFTQPIVVGEVMQNTETDDAPLGNFAGKASTASSGHFFDYFAKDYGNIVIIAHIRPKVLFTQGVDRNLIKKSRFDWYNPLFSNLSEQPVYKCEAHTAPVSSSSATSHALDVLGFNPRYSEMYFDKSVCCGDLRDNQPYWVWSREFSQNAVLNGEFALCKHSEYSDRWSVTDLPPFISLFNFVCDITRPCSAYPVPSK